MVTIGIDEVGRGCWAGPVVAGAVCLATPIEGVKDSKRLSKIQRTRLDAMIKKQATAYGLGWVWPQEIDEHGLTWAVKIAMERAFQELQIEHDEIIIDGNINYFPDNSKAKAVIKADDSVPSVAAASIIAKVARDNYMADLPEAYEKYGFSQHVGYGTAGHIAALQAYGISDIHRKSFKPIAALSSS